MPGEQKKSLNPRTLSLSAPVAVATSVPAVSFLSPATPPQIQYRLGNSKEAIALYSQLFRAHGAESREVQTNVLAAYVAGGRAGEVPAVMEAMKVRLGRHVGAVLKLSPTCGSAAGHAQCPWAICVSAVQILALLVRSLTQILL